MGSPVRPAERIATSAVLTIVPAALLVVSRAGESTGLAAFSPMFFPSGVLWCWLAVAAVCLASDVARARAARTAPDASDPPAGRMPRPAAARIAAVTIAMGAYVLAVTELGFLLTSIGFTVVTLLVLGTRSPAVLLGYGVLMPGVLFTLFNHVLGLPLPTSPFSHLF